MRTHILINAKGQTLNSDLNRPPYRGFKYPSFMELLTAAMHYRAYGEKVYVKRIR